MIAPLLWLLLAALGITPGQQVHVWDGRPPVVVIRPSEPRAGTPLSVTVAALPARARNVEIVLDGEMFPARREGRGLFRAQPAAPEAPGPATVSVRFSVGDRRFEAPGGVVVVAPPE